MVTRLLATLLTTVVLAGSAVLLGAAPAQACRCVQQGVTQQARAADLVVTGTIEGVRQGGADTERGTQQQGRGTRQLGNLTLLVAVDRVYAGALPDRTLEVTTAASTSACGLGRLPRGERYVFFLTADTRALRATSCNGTAPARTSEIAQVERVLGEGRTPGTGADGGADGGTDGGTGGGTGGTDGGSAEPAAVELTVVDDAPPPDATRTALPGGLLAVVGLVGLLVLGRLGSRRAG
ncbi:hypothetical protein [uncultured Nocardioides sp.]|uniref:hypothetical protein n=1 Tax=uncultured Nocardioides sp. TaxID=198441 RepID=UPI00263117C8|nr:hypothetical protein [uncultured Nocardioides sp.]